MHVQLVRHTANKNVFRFVLYQLTSDLAHRPLQHAQDHKCSLTDLVGHFVCEMAAKETAKGIVMTDLEFEYVAPAQDIVKSSLCRPLQSAHCSVFAARSPLSPARCLLRAVGVRTLVF